MSDTTELAKQLKEELGDNTDATTEELEESLENLLNYSVPEDEAVRSLRRKYSNTTGGPTASNGSNGDETVLLDTINKDEEWINVEVTVVDLWEPRHESISQVGLVGDESETMKFVAFKTSDLATLEEGKSYSLSPVVTDEYEGSYSIKLTKNTQITELDETVAVDDGSRDVTVPIVDVQDGSGLITRCPKTDDNDNTCGRPLKNGRCGEHGEVDGEFDLRIKAVADNGHDTIELIFDEERTEALTGMTLDEAKQMAKDAMDTSVVSDEIADQIVGNYYHITGGEFREYLLVDTCDPVEQDAETEARNLLTEVGA